MAIAEVKLVRKFRYQGITLSDPASDKTPEQVMKVYAFQYPELLNAVGDLFVTTKAQGTGLGLSVVQAVARAHHGKFLLQSTVGKGTCASLLIPFATFQSQGN